MLKKSLCTLMRGVHELAFGTLLAVPLPATILESLIEGRSYQSAANSSIASTSPSSQRKLSSTSKRLTKNKIWYKMARLSNFAVQQVYHYRQYSSEHLADKLFSIEAMRGGMRTTNSQPRPAHDALWGGFGFEPQDKRLQQHALLWVEREKQARELGMVAPSVAEGVWRNLKELPQEFYDVVSDFFPDVVGGQLEQSSTTALFRDFIVFCDEFGELVEEYEVDPRLCDTRTDHSAAVKQLQKGREKRRIQPEPRMRLLVDIYRWILALIHFEYFLPCEPGRITQPVANVISEEKILKKSQLVVRRTEKAKSVKSVIGTKRPAKAVSLTAAPCSVVGVQEKGQGKVACLNQTAKRGAQGSPTLAMRLPFMEGGQKLVATGVHKGPTTIQNRLSKPQERPPLQKSQSLSQIALRTRQLENSGQLYTNGVRTTARLQAVSSSCDGVLQLVTEQTSLLRNIDKQLKTMRSESLCTVGKRKVESAGGARVRCRSTSKEKKRAWR
eukprot:Lankesteria_metandrocarpae@DN3908_c0_g1_i1.p1